jgi:predicted GH43/DUF377 family glycosyl hydrolase
VSYSAYVDLDRNNLFKVLRISQNPILDLGKLGMFDEFGTYPVSVIQRGPDLLAYYAGWTRCVSVPFNTAIGIAKSTDGGNRFERFGDGPVLSYTANEPFVISGPKIRRFNGLYYLYYIAGKHWIPNNGKPEPVYTIRMATSTDGLKWEKQNREIISQKLDENEAQASPDVFEVGGKYHMFFCYRAGLNFRGKSGGYRIGYASSSDLLNWTRDDDMAGIDVSENGFDSEMVAYPHVFQLDGVVYMMYLGNQVGKFGIGLAKWEQHEMD